MGSALRLVRDALIEKYGATLQVEHRAEWYLHEIVSDLQGHFPNIPFHHHFNNTSIRPDGGILSIRMRSDDRRFPILIAEVKNQGTNDIRAEEGKPKQARGNAIERLGKNLIGLRTALLNESIFPFVCFGYGCDFEPSSSILDRVTTMAMFGPLNTTSLYNEGKDGRFNRGSFYFREAKWTVEEMARVMSDVATRSVQYYFSRYREDSFLEKEGRTD